MEISAVIPCHNQEATLGRVLNALRAQSTALRDIILIDDGSSDQSVAVADSASVRVVSLGKNLGRGAARARGLSETDAPFILMCDGGISIPPDFVTRARTWFNETQVAAVFGYVVQPPSNSMGDRWRGRHLFKADPPSAPHRKAILATGACILRTEAVHDAGGFDPALRSGEDADLGKRLLSKGWDVVLDPQLRITCLRSEGVADVLARYARWNSPMGMPFRAYLRQISYALKVMAAEDLRAGDPFSATISLICPHYQFWAPLVARLFR